MAADGEKGFLRKFGREGEGGKSPFREKKKKKTHKKQKRKGKILTARTEEKAETRESFTFKKKRPPPDRKELTDIFFWPLLCPGNNVT